jgi:two-component system C4-dicarboxylate transport sensor histidine kinase DctB
MHGWSIWSRLLLAVGIIVCIAGALLATGMALVLRAERDFANLAQDRIPRVALAGELAEFTGELAALSARIMAGSLDPSTAPDLPGTRVTAAARGIADVLAAPGLRDAPQAAALASAEADLRDSLDRFARLTEDSADLRRRLQTADEQLRWTQVDVQDQAGALLEDLSFNMDGDMRALIAPPTPDIQTALRLELERSLTGDRKLRDDLQRLAAEASTLSAVLLQARSVSDLAALEQVERLGRDTLDAMALARVDPAGRSDVRLMLEALDRLVDLTQGENSVFDLMRAQIELRDTTLVQLARSQLALGRMQAQLTDLGRSERRAAQSDADAAAQRILTGAGTLTILTMGGALLSTAILLLFVRNRIVRPIGRLTEDLMHIADAEKTTPATEWRGLNEMTRMEQAVGTFRHTVTDLKRAQRDLSVEVASRQQAVERLEKTQRELVQAGKMAALGQMSAAISHEINQPLAAIQHRLHALRGAHPEVTPAVERLEALTRRITGTISHLRRIARRSDHRRERVIISEPMDAVLDLLDHRLRETRTEVSIEPAARQLVVAGDEILIEQVLLNILGNALDAIEEAGSAPGQITVTAGPGQTPELMITDSGVGLRGHSGAEVVDPFFTTKEVGKGLGLGLSIVFNVMQDMGGQLDIGPASQGGAQVRLRFCAWPE